MDANLKRNLESLVADLIDGNLGGARRDELNFLLRDSEPCRRHFNALMDVQTEMSRLAGQPHGTSVKDLTNSVDGPNAPQLKSATTRSATLAWSIALASLAASLFLVVTLVRPFNDRLTETSQRTSANASANVSANDVQVVEASAAEYFDEGPTRPGERAALNTEYTLTSGTIKLAFPKGAEAILEAPSVFTVLAADRLSVKLGRCSLHAPDGAKGFRVETPQTEVVDLGTRFSINVNEEIGRASCRERV